MSRADDCAQGGQNSVERAGTSEPELSQTSTWLALGLITVVSAILCVWGLNRSLWYDEIATVLQSVRAPLSRILTHFPGDNDHLLYSVLAHLSISAFGEHPWSVRLPAVLFGVASVPMLFITARGVTTRFEALVAAGLLAVSYHHVWFSQNARAYTLMLFLTLLATHLLLVGLRQGRRAALIGYGVAMGLAAYAHLTMVLVTLAHGLGVLGYLWRPRNDAQLQTWLNAALAFSMAAAVALVLYAPLLSQVHAFFGAEGQGASIVSPTGGPLEALLGLGAGRGAVLAAALVVCAVGCWSYARQSWLVLALFLLPAVAIAAVALGLDRPLRPRFLFFSAGFLLLIAVRGAFGIVEAAIRATSALPPVKRLHPAALPLAAAAMAMAAAWPLPYLYRYPKQDFPGAQRFVEARLTPQDAVFTVGIGAELAYQGYYGQHWPRLYRAAELTAARQRHETVWLLYTFPSYVKAQAPDLVAAAAADCTQAEQFWGTLADGEIIVVRCPGTKTSPSPVASQ